MKLRFSLLPWMVVAALAGPAQGATARAPRYVPPIELEPSSPPKAYFAKDARSGQWCAMDKGAADRRAAAEQIDAEETGWIRYSEAGLDHR